MPQTFFSVMTQTDIDISSVKKNIRASDFSGLTQRYRHQMAHWLVEQLTGFDLTKFIILIIIIPIIA